MGSYGEKNGAGVCSHINGSGPLGVGLRRAREGRSGPAWILWQGRRAEIRRLRGPETLDGAGCEFTSKGVVREYSEKRSELLGFGLSSTVRIPKLGAWPSTSIRGASCCSARQVEGLRDRVEQSLAETQRFDLRSLAHVPSGVPCA